MQIYALGSILSHAPNLEQAGSGNGLQEGPVRQCFFQISSRQPGMFAGQVFRVSSLPVLDGIEDRPVMLFRDREDFPRSGQRFGQKRTRAWGDKREPVDLVDGAAKDLIVGEVQ